LQTSVNITEYETSYIFTTTLGELRFTYPNFAEFNSSQNAMPIIGSLVESNGTVLLFRFVLVGPFDSVLFDPALGALFGGKWE